MTKRTSIRLTIVGDEYAIRTDETPERAQAAAQHVEKTIRMVQNAGGASDPRKAAVMAALQITDELFQERDAHAEFAERLRALSAEVKRMLPPGKR